MERIVRPQQDYNFDQLEHDICVLEERYPEWLTVEIIGYSVQNKPIYAVRLGHGDKKILFNGAHHAREWLTSVLLMDMIETYCDVGSSRSVFDAQELQNLCAEVSIWFIPMVNPDGVTIVQAGPDTFKNKDELIRWNDGQLDFQAWKANSRGVDLNRQYPIDWEWIQENPMQPAPSNYKGINPLSEPEARAVYHFVLLQQVELAVAYHSSGEEIFWKYKSSGNLAMEAQYLAQLISEKTGYDLIDPGENPSGGGFTDWFLMVIKKPSFTIEIAPYIGPKPVPLQYYEKIWEENKEVPYLLAKKLIENKDE
ncbi:g-D-glutamyl-meso-diaminopimelate peptidase [Natronobacillus azotifigens]|uniref:M14 family metallocarboxypeptidase n=1 Tax=Natronobacillus azotifigens TaxID=472978 RepID=A0A9J6RCK8_9BACI|nr:M14 family metallocarboxypeptidase [Natronobacillus azotifigens]MCZ0703279.1 M14 family metallocarboxypeptidase [Natronobacillus azotifigens]